MQPGPAPKPTVIREKQGNLGKVPIDPREPRPEKLSKRVPKYMTKGGKEMWRRFVDRFWNMGLLTTWDEFAFATWCEWAFILVDSLSEMEKSRDIAKLTPGISAYYKGLSKHPLLNVLSLASDHVRKIGSEFGMTPAMRTRLILELEGEDKSLAEILFSGD